MADARTVAFLTAMIPLIGILFAQWNSWTYLAVALGVGGYALLASLHDRTLKSEARARAQALLCDRSLDRIGEGWRHFLNRGDRYLAADHPYAADLNVYGQASLFQRLDETATVGGEMELAHWLRAASTPAEVLERQTAVRRLQPEIDFRQALLTELELLRPSSDGSQKSDPGGFIDWAQRPADLQAIRWARPLAWPLPLVTAALFLLGRWEQVPRTLFWAPLVAQLTVAAICAGPLGRLYRGIASGERRFRRYEESFRILEAAPLPLLLSDSPGGTPASPASSASKELGRFGRLFAFAELRQSPQLHAAIQALTLWDLHWLFRLEDWRSRCGNRVRGWFQALSQTEALLSLAGFAHDHPEFAFPQFESDEAPRLEGRALGHPLLVKPVPNDIRLARDQRALVITGSNMSGKSTWVRALGLNAVLAQMGAPVCAESLALSPLKIFTSMRLSDSLERGLSYFHAEVQRLRLVLEGARTAHGQALFLLDEMLLGTNTRERQLASQSVLKLLLATGAIGAVTTHDLALAELARDPQLKLSNVHFRDLLEGGEMRFDYRMQAGVATSTNALRVLQDAGIPIHDGIDGIDRDF